MRGAAWDTGAALTEMEGEVDRDDVWCAAGARSVLTATADRSPPLEAQDTGRMVGAAVPPAPGTIPWPASEDHEAAKERPQCSQAAPCPGRPERIPSFP